MYKRQLRYAELPTAPTTTRISIHGRVARLLDFEYPSVWANARVLSDGTYVWVTGTTNNGLTAFAECYDPVSRWRKWSRDFTITRTSAMAGLSMNASGDIFVISAASLASVERFSFTAPANAAPAGTVPLQTAYVGNLLRINLSEFVTGFPDPTFATIVGDTSFGGTGFTWLGFSPYVFGTPSASNIGMHNLNMLSLIHI